MSGARWIWVLLGLGTRVGVLLLPFPFQTCTHGSTRASLESTPLIRRNRDRGHPCTALL